MGCQQYVAPGIVLVLVKLTGTTLFVAFIPQIFSRGNFSSAPEENYTVLQTTQSPSESPWTTPMMEVPTTVQLPELRWESYGRSSYWFSEHVLEWVSSYSECESQGSNLVIINDENEMKFLQNRTRNADYFIGLEYPDTGSKWIWLDGTELRGNLFTMKRNQENKQCATLRGREVSPAFCHQKNRWICEKAN